MGIRRQVEHSYFIFFAKAQNVAKKWIKGKLKNPNQQQ